MKKAMIIVREHDKDTGAYAVLDMYSFDLTADREKIKEHLNVMLLPFLLKANEKHSEISDIQINFSEKET